MFSNATLADKETTEMVASPVTTPLVKITPTVGTGFSNFPLLLGLELVIILLSAVTLIIAGIVRRK